MGLWLALTLTSSAQVPNRDYVDPKNWIQYAPGHYVRRPTPPASKDAMRIHKLEKEMERLELQITFLQVQIDSLIHSNDLSRSYLNEIDVDEENRFVAGRNRNKEGLLPHIPGGALGIPELDTARMNEFIDTLGEGPDTGHISMGGVIQTDTSHNVITFGGTGTVYRLVDTIWTNYALPSRLDTVEQVRTITDENKSTFWHQRCHHPFIARIFVITDGWGRETGYLTRFKKPVPRGFKIWPK